MPTPIQIQATKLEIPYSLSQLDNKKNEIAALVESLGLTFEGEQNLYDTLVALGIEQVKLGEQYDSIDLTRSAESAPINLKITEYPQVGLAVDTSEGTAIVAVDPKPSLSVSIESSNDVDVQTKEKLSVTVINPNKYIYTQGVAWGDLAGNIVDQTDLVDYVDQEIAAIPSPTLDSVTSNGSTTTNNVTVGGLTAGSLTYPSTDGTVGQFLSTDGAGALSFETPATPPLDTVTTEGATTTNAIEVGGITSNGLAKIVEDTLPTLQILADSTTNPAANEQMGSITFTRNFDSPNVSAIVSSLYTDFTERVELDGGEVEGTLAGVTSDISSIVTGQILVNTAQIRPVYVGASGDTSADLVFFTNTNGAISEKFRVTAEGNVEVKESLAGVVIRSRNNTPYRILVDNDGRLESTALDAAAPVINGVPTISGIVAITEIITATKASVTSSPALTTTYQWQVSDNGTTGWSNISGATSSTYLIPLEYANKFLRVQQIETNILGQATANSASTTAVIPSLLVSAMIQRLGNFENETYVYNSLVEFDAIEI